MRPSSRCSGAGGSGTLSAESSSGDLGEKEKGDKEKGEKEKDKGEDGGMPGQLVWQASSNFVLQKSGATLAQVWAQGLWPGSWVDDCCSGQFCAWAGSKCIVLHPGPSPATAVGGAACACGRRKRKR